MSLVKDIGFVHLHMHSAFSLREGALTIARLISLALADGMPALAMTDTNNLFGALEFSEKASKEGLQPIVGMRLAVDFGDGAAFGSRQDMFGAGRASIVLLGQNEKGWQNLMRLASCAWLDAAQGEDPHVALGRLAEHSEGIIALTGGPSGPLDRAFAAERPEQAAARFAHLRGMFGNQLYLEMQRHGLDSERAVEPLLVDMAYRQGIPLVATNESFFAFESDYAAHDALLCIADGTFIGADERRRVTREHRFKTRAEMTALFSDVPEALENSVEIALRCAYRPRTRQPILPRYTAADGAPMDEIAELRRQAEEGLVARLAAHGPAEGFSEQDYEERLAFELDVIIRMQFPGYFLIVADFIRFAKNSSIPVGPGRGSGAGSLVAYCLTITDLDPMRFGLLFERFLNPERVSMPDFDIDFCQYRRDEVIAYVRRRYGEDRVAQIITFGSFLARGVLRNVGRVLEMPLGQVDRLAKMVPHNPAKPISLKEAVATEPRLSEAAEAEPRVRQLLKIAETLEGLYSNASTHAAGIVIGDRPLDQLVPLYRDPKSDMPATQFNMKWVEPAGLVKFDFLGLKTLTTLAITIDLLKKRGIEIDLSRIRLDDAKTYEMLSRGETIGVFQVESAGMRKALVDMRPDRLEDIIALVALYRPGPMANIPTYCAVKRGDETANYIHPALEKVLGETFGVIIYQEQVMQIAQILSGYSLGEADMLRRAMGKKIKAEMDAQRERFVSGAVERGTPKAKADEIFDLLAKFADYGFNKSHAAAYALIAYQTAWFKANYPFAFLAASMTLDKSNTDKLAEFRNDVLRLGIVVAPPSINGSGVDFEIFDGADGKPAIAYALSAVKGVGEGQATAIVQARGKQPFVSLTDFARRINPREVNKKALESLAAAGAFDALEPDRARASAAMELVLAYANRTTDETMAGQSALFGAVESAESLAIPKVQAWPATERLKQEFAAVGFFLSGHPLDSWTAVLKRLRVETWSSYDRAVRQQGAFSARLAATVIDKTERRTKTGSKMGIILLSDPTGQYEATLFQEGLVQYRDVLEKGSSVLVSLLGTSEGEDVRSRIAMAEPLAVAANRIQKGLRIFVRDESPLPTIQKELAARGESEISLVLMLEENSREVEMKLPGKFLMTPAIAQSLQSVAGVVSVEHL